MPWGGGDRGLLPNQGPLIDPALPYLAGQFLICQNPVCVASKILEFLSLMQVKFRVVFFFSGNVIFFFTQEIALLAVKSCILCDQIESQDQVVSENVAQIVPGHLRLSCESI